MSMRAIHRRSGWRLLGLAGAMILLARPAGAQPAFRAFWADAFHPGYKSIAEIDDMVARAVQGRYNAIIAEVLAYHDTGTGAHGAYWNSAYVPRASDIGGGIDPLAELCARAHAQGLEVHAWLVSFRVSTVWPPAGNSIIGAHPEWLAVTRAKTGLGPSTIPVSSGKYTLDAGSPDVQQHLVDIVRELVSNYPIDGINWDYIRYTQQDAGYPASNTYTNSGLARYQRITGTSGTPTTTDPGWSDFRRQTITELVRRCRAEVASISSNPRQPLRHTADLICPGDAPAGGNFANSDAYKYYFQDWRLWMENGWLDAGVPMNYKDDRNSTHAQWYRNWINATVGWRYQRHMYCGQGNYMNSKANSVAQLQYVYGAGANGSSNYSYYSTADEDDDGNEEADFTWYPYVAANIFTAPVATPSMPWRNPATASEGTLWGRITSAKTGAGIDNATVQVGAQPPVQTDGNGYYTVTLIPAEAGGTSYDVAASAIGFDAVTQPGVAVFPGELRRADLALTPGWLLTNFDGYVNDATVMFQTPRYSSTSIHLASDPDIAAVTDEVPDFTGVKSDKISWQFVDGGTQRWLRLTTANTANLANPTVSLSKPIRVRIRMDNGTLRVTLGLRETGTTAQIGADGGTSGTIEWVGAGSQIDSAPQGKPLSGAPGRWQTFYFDPASDPIRAHTGDGVLSSPTGKGTLEHLAFASTGQAGPFTLYLDEVKQLEEVPPAWRTDIDQDSDVDLSDFGTLQACLSGAGSPPGSGCPGADFDRDNDVDNTDLGVFLSCLGEPTDRDCPNYPN